VTTSLDGRVTATASWPVWGTTADVVVTEPDRLDAAWAVVEGVLAEVDQACSRFRPDSELTVVQAQPETSVRVTPLLAELVATALTAARRTDGDVDPTVGSWLVELGYDRDLSAVPADPRAARVSVSLAPDWRRVHLDGDRLTLPAGVVLDLGATAKAYAADRAARAVASGLACGVAVSLGGDVATAGPAPDGGWLVLVQDGDDEPACTITLPAGGAVATSSTRHGTWWRGGQLLHHILDPRTGAPAGTSAGSPWRTASAAAADCVSANTATTAALVRGPGALVWLRRTGLPARLVAADGSVVTVGGWPA
jgi:FAD:protein FMN transferase